MNIIQAVILGIVEGVTEFLPVSSTFHLIWAAKILHLTQTDFLKLFEVAVQPGAIIAVLFIYAKDFFTNRKLFINMVFSFVPTAIAGLVLYKVIKNLFFENMLLQLAAFAGVGLLFIILEKLWRKKKLTKNVTEMKPKEAVIIGLIQSLAVVPGVSRAGAVMVGLMGFGYSREESARYSFLIAVPTIVAAGAYDLFKMRHLLAGAGNNAVYLLIGLVASFVSAYFVVSWLLSYLKKNSLVNFGIYRIVLAIILALVFLR